MRKSNNNIDNPYNRVLCVRASDKIFLFKCFHSNICFVMISFSCEFIVKSLWWNCAIFRCDVCAISPLYCGKFVTFSIYTQIYVLWLFNHFSNGINNRPWNKEPSDGSIWLSDFAIYNSLWMRCEKGQPEIFRHSYMLRH